MTREQLEEQEEAKRFPDQTITWEMEEEVPATKILVDVEAGNRTNKMMNVFHLPHETPDKWMEGMKDLIIDVAKGMVGEEQDTTVGEMSVGQQHIADWLNNHASQQEVLFFACNHIYGIAIKMAEARMKDRLSGGILDLLQHLHGDGDKH